MNRKTIPILTLLAFLELATNALAGDRHPDNRHLDNRYLDPIYATSAAQGDILDLLRQDREVITFDSKLSPPYSLGPVVMTAADLDNPAVTRLLKDAYGAGKTIAILGATQDEADRFQHFFGLATTANCEPPNGAQTIAVYGLQASIARRPPLISSYCLAGTADLHQRGRDGRQARRAVRRWLETTFAAPAPEPPAATATDDSDNIVDMATAYHCNFITTADPDGPESGRTMQIDTYITGARSFDNFQDIYYVENDLQYYQGESDNPNYAYAVLGVGATGVNFNGGDVSESKSQPASQSAYISSVTNTTTTTLSGSIGFNASQGPNATIGGSVTHGKSVALSIPPIMITNNTESVPPLPQWTFQVQAVKKDTNFQPGTSWFWTVPETAYADNGANTTGSLSFRQLISMGGTLDNPLSGDFAAETTCSAPYPFFGIWQVDPPTILDVSPASVPIGQTFTIEGTEMYAGLVTNVFIEGNAIPASNITPRGLLNSLNGTNYFAVDVQVPSEINGTATPTGDVSLKIQTTYDGNNKNSNIVTINITK
jgi:hypothetical protein